MKKFSKLLLSVFFILGMITGCSSGEETLVTGDEEKEVVYYKIQLNLSCDENLFFSRYDLDILLDGILEGTLEHGTVKSFDFELEEGVHELIITKEGESDVDGTVIFNVKEDATFQYKIHCTNNQVEIEEIKEDSDLEEVYNDEVEEEKNEESSNYEEIGKNIEEDESIIEEVLTVENCPELKEMLSKKSSGDASYSDFAKKHKGKTIEFDGSVDNVMLHGNYDTRYDLLLTAGNFSETTVRGPAFKFEDINYSDLDLSFENVNLNELYMKNVHIIAKVKEFNQNTELFFLEPITITVR